MATVKPCSLKEKGKKNDLDIIKWLEDKDFSYYVKALIRADMKANGEIVVTDNANSSNVGKEEIVNKREITQFDFDF